MGVTECRRRRARRFNKYVRSEAGFRRNLLEIGRLRERLATARNASTAAALERREAASRQWVNGETAR